MWVPFYLGKQSTRWTTMWHLRHFVCWQITPAKVKVHRGRSFVQQTYFIPKCKQRRCGWGGDRVLFLRGTKIRWQVTQLLSLWIYFHFRSFPIFPWVSEIQTGYICQPDLTLMHCNKEAVSLNWKTCKIVQLPWSLMRQSKHDGPFGHELNWLSHFSHQLLFQCKLWLKST